MASRANEAWLFENVSSREPIGTIDFATLQPSNIPVDNSSGFENLCSYSWQDCKEPTILVPGCAPKWKNNKLPVRLQRYQGSIFIDQNGARNSSSPWEPAFRALSTMQPSIQLDDIDIVTNRNSLKKLLDFANPEGYTPDSFRIGLMMVGNTLFLERRERANQKFGDGGQNFGIEFERAFTTPADGEEESTGYHRVIKYNFGGLECVVRFEVDACYLTSKVDNDLKFGGGTRLVMEGDTGATDVSLDSLTDAVKSLNIESSGSSSSKASKSVPVASPGPSSSNPMPHSYDAELKTSDRPRSVERYLAQLWFSRTPWLIFGLHTGGTFRKIDATQIRPETFASFERRLQTPLRKIAKILTQFREIAKRNEGKHCIAVFESKGRWGEKVIKVYSSSLPDKQPLPQPLITKFWKV